ncbi:zinc ribbon domain-containing protein [Saccharomonospora saliphila]|uniref:zinc ribbon domain-containing protein n=1 Tax=Saccharomonospora saliphila TaxID=369829 RepID=UPI000366867C|nr:C4-type zinc ribbon domain-containing protein [Saccharomonospora saliphila]
MKAEPTAQRQLLDLAKIDAELSRVAHRRRTLPELAEITEAEQRVRDRSDALVSVQTSASDLDREVTKQESEVESVRARAERDRKLMEQGSVSAKQLTELEHEMDTLARRQAALEDDQLELMERKEAVDADVQRTAAEVDEAERALADARKRRDEAVADLDATQARREADREGVTPTLPEDVLALYERVRAHRGIGAALLKSRRCGACQLELDRSTIAEIKNTPPDEIVQCDNCEAILVRTLESGL